MSYRRLRDAVVALPGIREVFKRLDRLEMRMDELAALASTDLGSVGLSAPQTADLEAFMDLHNPFRYEYPLFVDYPVRPKRRYTPENPHPLLYALIDKQRPTFEHWLSEMANLREYFAAIAMRAEGKETLEPFWLNGWLPGLDALTLYTLMAKINPALYVEIGSGNSTKFARRAILDHRMRAQVVSVDPQPRAQVEELCDRAVRVPLEDVDLALFEDLASGDMLFVDSSHRIFQNSDVTILLLDVLPYLKPGVLVHFHDIHLPYDYPEDWKFRYYSEQYGLAMILLTDRNRRYQIVMANSFISRDIDLQRLLRSSVQQDPRLADIEAFGGSLWLQIGE